MMIYICMLIYLDVIIYIYMLIYLHVIIYIYTRYNIYIYAQMERMYISFGEHFRASGPMQVGELLFDQTSLLF